MLGKSLAYLSPHPILILCLMQSCFSLLQLIINFPLCILMNTYFTLFLLPTSSFSIPPLNLYLPHIHPRSTNPPLCISLTHTCFTLLSLTTYSFSLIPSISPSNTPVFQSSLAQPTFSPSIFPSSLDKFPLYL